ncbi:MAG: HPr family phosphocarrier protein [Lachnospiraceae bacterium]|nr:HPr family phosphocarrier protein [Lachnospiraceae bacterium]
MKSVKVNINSIDKVKKFVNILTKYDGDFDLVSGHYVIDAKSIMGIFSLDLSEDLELVLQNSTDQDEVLEAIKEFTV